MVFIRTTKALQKSIINLTQSDQISCKARPEFDQILRSYWTLKTKEQQCWTNRVKSRCCICEIASQPANYDIDLPYCYGASSVLSLGCKRCLLPRRRIVLLVQFAYPPLGTGFNGCRADTLQYCLILSNRDKQAAFSNCMLPGIYKEEKNTWRNESS